MTAPPPFTLQNLLDKMSNPDSDFRFMSLNDLLGMLTSANLNFAASDAGLMNKLVDAVVKALDDGNGEVQNLAVKCLGPLVLRIRENAIAPLILRLTDLSMTSQDPSIPSTALRTIIANLPRPPSGNVGAPARTASTDQASTPSSINASLLAVQRTLIPKLLVLLQPEDTNRSGGASLDSVDLLIETVKCFGPCLNGAEVEKLQVAVMRLLESDRSSGVVKKRAVTALSLLCVHAPDELLSSFITHLIESFRAQSQHVNPTRLRLLISVTGSLARGIPARFGPYLKTVCPFILSVVDGKDVQNRELGEEPEMEMDEVREAALVALESFQSCCTEEMKIFTDDILNAATVFLKYDPNYADPSDEDDEEMGGTQGEGDEDDDGEFGDDDDDAFEEDGNFSDEDDISWKVRRCAAKLLATVICTRAADLIRGQSEEGGKAYKVIAPLLVDRFREREENVRLEVLATATSLVIKTGEVAEGKEGITVYYPSKAGDVVMGPPSKTRRGSDASMLDNPATHEPEPVVEDSAGVKTSLAALVPRLCKSLGKHLNNKATTLPTKQASVTLLAAVVSVLRGGLEDTLSIFIDPLADAVKGGSSLSAGGNVIVASAAGGSAATATGSSVRIEVLRLLAKVFENHSVDAVGKYLELLVPSIAVAVEEKGYKLAFESLATTTALVRLLTSQGAQKYSGYLKQLYDVVIKKVQNSDNDLEVREKAIITLGVILSRTSGDEKWIGAIKRRQALIVLLERLRNETTRVTAARAIENIARTTSAPEDVDAQWVQGVVMECGAQLRKSHRGLKATSLEALRSIAANPYCREKIDVSHKQELVNDLVPLLVVGDMHLLALSIGILRNILSAEVGTTEPVLDSICDLVKSPLGSGTVVQNLLALIGTIGEVDQEGKGKLMAMLLRNVGVTGDTSIVAKVIAQLLVKGAGSDGRLVVGVDDFVSEASVVDDERRKCLALMVLGEVGLRMGPKFPIEAETFITHFSDTNDDVPIAAAVALGLAGAGNVNGYLPVIMERLKSGKEPYLLVHSLKEIIQHSGTDESVDIKEYSTEIWDTLLSTTAASEDAKAVAAECVGRLTILDPWSYLPGLQKHLRSPEPTVRGMVISALRYTFTDTDESYDELLRPIVVDFLESMLQDTELENRRLALTTLNSAASNKSHLLGSGLNRLLPLVYRDSVIRPELIREIQMGPFKHKVDDGLEVRKSAYETLYALLETSFQYLDASSFLDRAIAGLSDESDIKQLANLMVGKMAGLWRDETAARLDMVADALKSTLTTKPKENAVKQEVERFAEGVKGALKVAVILQKNYGALAPPKWRQFWEFVLAGYSAEVTALINESAKEV